MKRTYVKIKTSLKIQCFLTYFLFLSWPNFKTDDVTICNCKTYHVTLVK